MRGPSISEDIQRLVQGLATQAGIAVDEGDLPDLAALYEDFLQLLDTIESVDLDPGEESALGLDLFAWETTADGAVVAREGDAF